MAKKIKAIQTRYKGYRFRSRLEARYAVFFDALGVKYEYEPEGYDLGSLGWYLPDFYLPEINSWIEIKGGPASIKETDKCKAFFDGKCDRSEATDLIALADSNVTWGIFGKIFAMAGENSTLEERKEILSSITNEVRKKEKVYLLEGLLENGWFMTNSGSVQINPTNAIWFATNKNKSDIHEAFVFARSARFEHGETPA